jgi:hypothetical protein
MRTRGTALALAVLLLLVAAAPAAAGPFVPSLHRSAATVWAVGDGADGGSEGRAVAGRIARLGIDRLLYLGDVYPAGTASDYRANYATTYGRFAAITAPTPGNHEWPTVRQGYDPYWARVRHRAPPPYYAFTVAGWRILSLNSQVPHDAGSPQVRWLRREVRGRGDCRIAFWHRPRYSAGTHGDAPDVQPLLDALRGHARITVHGHDHDMQRFARRDGIVEFVSGAGGTTRYPVQPRAGLAFGDARDDGALRLRLRRGAARFSFVSTAGRTLDAGRVSCDPGRGR